MTQRDVFAAILSALEKGAASVTMVNGDTQYVLTRTPFTRISLDEGKIRGVQLDGPCELLERLGDHKTTTVARAISGYGETRVVHLGHLDIGDWWRTGEITNVVGAQ